MFVELENELVVGLGVVTGGVELYQGCWGTFDSPPDEPEIIEIELVDAKGQDIDPDAIFDNPVLLKALETKTLGIIQELDEKYNREE